MPSHQISVSVQSGSIQASSARTLSYPGIAEVQEDTLAIGTDVLVNIAFPFTQLKSFVALSTIDAMIETNSGSAPGNTVNIKANIPYIWSSDTGVTNPFTVDVSKFYMTTTGSGTYVLKVSALYDSTP